MLEFIRAEALSYKAFHEKRYMTLDKNKPFPKRPRLPGFDYMGRRAYFITISTKDKNKFFCEHDIVNPLIEFLKETAEKECFLVDVFCFMPDHLHLLVKGNSDQANLNNFVKYFKQKSGFWFKQKYHKNLWQLSFYDHIIRKQEALEDVVRYILHNPLRKGMVSDFKEYRFSGSFTMDIHKL